MKGSVSDARFIEGDFQYLVGFPEAFLDKCVCNVMKTWQHRVCWVTIDEAHCILQWGSSFRPEYGNVVKLRTIFLSAHVLTLTATATIKAVHQLCQQLALKVIMCCSFTYSIIVVIMLNNCWLWLKCCLCVCMVMCTVDGQQIVLHASIVQWRTSVYMEDVGSNPTRSKHNSLFISNYWILTVIEITYYDL